MAAKKKSAVPSARKSKLEESPVRVVIVDDHALVRRGLTELIDDEPDMEVCGDAGDVAAAEKLVEARQPDVAIIDISLGGRSGLELVRHIKTRHPDVQMIALSMHDEKLFAERALRAGAKAYLNKEEPAEKVIDAIREVLAGRIYLSGEMADRILHRLVSQGQAVEESPIDSLSDRELEVLELIGRGLTTRQIAQRLHLSKKTVDTYRDHLKRKLQLRTANELVRYAVAWTLDQEVSD
ncbi:MAG: response regulator transcription factor [Gemmatimonadales bacterium]|jgi:DNA-binding NarL/FixJ family response regulator